MTQCQFCKAKFTNEAAYQIHLGIGAPAFHPCNDATEMTAKGMTQNQDGEWAIDENLITHQENWAYLKQAYTQARHPFHGTDSTR
jgi:hypothetical protein